jgi:hypothetical protein
LKRRALQVFYVNSSQRDNEAISCPTAQNALARKSMAKNVDKTTFAEASKLKERKYTTIHTHRMN